MLIQILEKVFKNAQKKVISKTSLTNMSKSVKSAITVTFLIITFFCTTGVGQLIEADNGVGVQQSVCRRMYVHSCLIVNKDNIATI